MIFLNLLLSITSNIYFVIVYFNQCLICLIFAILYTEVKIIMFSFIIITLLSMRFPDTHSSKHYEEYNDVYLNIDQLNNEKELNSTLQRETKSQKRNICDEDKIMFHLAELQVINPESVILIASDNNAEQACRTIAAGLDSIDSFMKTCIPLPQDHLYMQLISGIHIFNNNICINSDYYTGFKKHVSCYQELHNEYLDCVGPADWTENMKDQELCNQFKFIADCYFIKTAVLCGSTAAKTIKALVVDIINAITNVKCHNINTDPDVPDLIPGHFLMRSDSWFILINFKLIFVCLCVMQIFVILQ